MNNNLEYINPIIIAEKAYDRAINLLNSSPTYTGEYIVIFEPRSSCDFLEILAQSFIGENIFKKRTLLKDNMTFSKKVNLYDDPMISESSLSYYFDGEGVYGVRKPLVEKGKIKDFLYDNYYGKKMGKRSSGNSIRNKVSAPPRNWFSTVVLEKGDDDISSIIRGKKVIKVISLIGMHLVNPITGDFSVGFEGYLIDDGNYIKALSGVSLAGNLKDFYKNIIAVGSDLSVYGQTASPSILVDGIVVSGI
jgi:PmbA protein